jgi:hypothetical protein
MYHAAGVWSDQRKSLPAAADVCLLVRQLSGLIWSITQPTMMHDAILISFLTPEDSWSSTNPLPAVDLMLWPWQMSFSSSVSYAIWAKYWTEIGYTLSSSFSSHSFQELREICSLPLRTYSRQSLTVPLCTKQTRTTNTHVHSSLYSFERNNARTQEQVASSSCRAVSPGSRLLPCDFSGFTDWLRAAWGKPLIYSACVIMSSNSIHWRIEISNALNAGWRWILETLHACSSDAHNMLRTFFDKFGPWMKLMSD